MCTNFLTKQTTLTFWGSNLPKNGFWGPNLKNLSLDSDSTPLCAPIFSQNRLFGLSLGELPNYVQCFGSNIVKDVAESWVEVEMS